MKIVFAGFIYLMTQLGKMLALATFFPSLEPSDTGSSFNVIGELLKTSVDLADLVGLYFIINRVVGKPELKGVYNILLYKPGVGNRIGFKLYPGLALKK